jgi:hypothetical protein
MKTTFTSYSLKLMAQGNKIVIASGEGEQGSYTEYKGKNTERALKAHLTKEKCHGDRWAKAYVFTGESNWLGNIFINIENGQEEHINL